MPLVVHRAPHLRPLVEALAGVLAAPPPDPFTPELVVVPTAGVRDWVRRELSGRLGAGAHGDGVAANLDLVFPERFVARALAGGFDPEADPWHVERLMWLVLEVLVDPAADVPLAGPDRASAATARRVADLFDRYAVHRPAMLRQWAAEASRPRDATPGPDGELPAERRWQHDLWLAVHDLARTPSPAERIPGLLEQLRAGTLGSELPGRVAVFGIASLAPAQLAVAEAVAQSREVHVFLRVPSPGAWSTIRPVGHATPVTRADLDVAQMVSHPLLASWGRPSLETAALVKAAPAEHRELPDPPPTRPGSLLHHIRTGLLLDRPPAGGTLLDPESRADLLAGGDGTVQVHACHGPSRQVEVLHDALLHLFEDHPDLLPRDVLVLCPDLDTFAPLVTAVFDGRAGGAPHVPVRVGDRTLTTTNPIAATLQTVLGLAAGRATATEITALAAADPVRRRLGLTDDDLALLDRWAGDLGVRWGLRAGDRVSWGLPADVTQGTWRTALDRLLAGVALPAPSPRAAVGGIAPFDDVAGSDVESAGRIAELLARLEHTVDDLATPRPLAAWCDAVERVVGLLLAPDPDARWQLGEVLDLVGTLRLEATVGGVPSEVPLTLADLRVLVTRRLSGAGSRPDFRSGAVTVTSLVPQRGVPARVVCILGLDEAAVRVTGVDGDDILLVHPCVGERDARGEARQLLLDAVLAAEDVLLVTCTGHDVTTNQPVPFPVALEELLDVVAGTLHDLDGLNPATSCAALTHHPRQGFDDRALGITPPGARPLRTGGAWSFDPLAMKAAVARRRGGAPAPAAEPLAPLVSESLALAQLVQACTRPVDAFVEQRLGARPPRRPEGRDDGLALDLGPLERATVGRELLGCLARGGDPDAWRATRPLLGDLPPADLAVHVLTTVSGEIDQLVDTVVRLGGSLASTDAHEVEVTLPHGPTVVASIPGGHDRVLTRAGFVRWRPGLALAAALEVAALTLDDDAPWSAVVVGRGAGRESPPKSTVVRLAGDGRAERRQAAIRLLHHAVTFHRRALCEPLPVFERASYAVATSASTVESGLRLDLLYGWAGLVYPGVTVAELDAEQAQPHDPDPSAEGGRWRALAHHLWGEVRATTEGVV